MITASSAYTTANAARSKTPIHVVKINPHPNMLVSAWELSETSGQRADQTGRNELTPLNTPGTSVGKTSGTALQLTAASSQSLYRLVYDNNCLIVNDESFMGHIWVYMDSKVTFRTIVSHWKSQAPDQSWYLWYNSGTDRFEFNILDTAVNQYTAQASSFGSPSTGTWYFIVFWFDKTAMTVNIQVNNGTVNSSATGTAPLQPSSVPFRIGAIDATPDDVPDNFWNGRLQQFVFWRRILTAAELTAIYNGNSGVPLTTVTDPNPYVFSTCRNFTREDLGSQLLELGELNYETLVDQAQSGPISTLTFSLKDTNQAISSIVASGLVGYKVRLYAGFNSLTFSDYVQIFGGRITEIKQGSSGRYNFICRSFLTYAQDKLIFDATSTTLQVAVNSSDTTFTVADASSFPNAQSVPQSFRRLILTDTELCDYRGKTKLASGFWNLTSVVRSASGGFPFPPLFGAPASHSQNAIVRHLPKLGSHVPETSFALNPWLHPIRHMIDVSANVGNQGIGEFVIPLDGSWATAETLLGRALQMRYVFNDAVNGKSQLEAMAKDVGGFLVERADGRLGIKLIPMAPTLHAAWKFEETSGARIDAMHVDRSRNYYLEPSGSPGSNPGKIGTAAQFNSASSQYFWRSYGGLQPAAESFSVAVWLYLDVLTSGMTVVSQYDLGANADQVWRLIHAGGRFTFQITNGAGSTASTTANSFGAPTTATWYFVQASYNRDTGDLKISVNDGAVDTANTGFVPPTSTEEFRVGAIGNGGGTTGYWEGRIDELGVWYNHVLTAAEITWLYNSNTGRAIETFPTQFPSSSPSSVDSVTDAYARERPQWLRNGEQAFNHVIVHYDYIPPTDKYTSTFDYKNYALINAIGKDIPLEIFSRGIRSRLFVSGPFVWYDSTERFLTDLCERYIQRLGREAPFIGVRSRYSKHLLESMNDVTATFDQVVDLTIGSRALSGASVEISKLRHNFQTYDIELELAKLP